MTNQETLKITVNVTEEDIKNGVKEDCEACPIALALIRTVPGTYAEVNNNYIIVREYVDSATDKKCWRAWPSDLVRAFIEDFDQGVGAHPTTFNLVFHRFRPFR